MKITKAFMGCADGEVYPVEYQPGQECPPELEAAARELGALDARKLSKKEQEEEAARLAAEQAAAEEAAAKEAAEKAAATGAPSAA